MLKQEFEKLAGYEVSADDYYNIIEKMYMATDLNKEDFVKVIDKKRFALPTRKQMVNAIVKEAEHLKETCTHYTDYESEERMDQAIKAYMNRFYGIDMTKEGNGYEIKEKELWTCYYPTELEFYINWRTVERIELTK